MIQFTWSLGLRSCVEFNKDRIAKASYYGLFAPSILRFLRCLPGHTQLGLRPASSANGEGAQAPHVAAYEAVEDLWRTPVQQQ